MKKKAKSSFRAWSAFAASAPAKRMIRRTSLGKRPGALSPAPFLSAPLLCSFFYRDLVFFRNQIFISLFGDRRRLCFEGTPEKVKDQNTQVGQQQMAEPSPVVAVVAAPITTQSTTTRTASASGGNREWIWWVVAGVALAAVLAAIVGWLVYERSKAAAALLPITPATNSGGGGGGTGPFYPVTPVVPSGGGGGPFYPVTPAGAQFTRASDTNSVASVLADFGLSEQFADPAVGTFTGSAGSVDLCQARCSANARCVQYVYDAGAQPPNPLWSKNGCWLRYQMPASNETTSAPGFITGTRRAA
nr:PAN APPLE domain containing protein [Pandoravirus aubagnensis]